MTRDTKSLTDVADLVRRTQRIVDGAAAAIISSEVRIARSKATLDHSITQSARLPKRKDRHHFTDGQPQAGRPCWRR